MIEYRYHFRNEKREWIRCWSSINTECVGMVQREAYAVDENVGKRLMDSCYFNKFILHSNRSFQIINTLDITDEHIGDDTAFSSLMDQCYDNTGESKIKKVLADGAYDRVKIYQYLYLNGIKSGIKMRKDAVTEFKGSHYRVECVSNRNKIGHSAWKNEVGYGKRWSSEAVFSSVKRMLGEAVQSKSKEGSLRDAYRKYVYYNVMNNYGRGRISGI